MTELRFPSHSQTARGVLLLLGLVLGVVVTVGTVSLLQTPSLAAPVRDPARERLGHRVASVAWDETSEPGDEIPVLPAWFSSVLFPKQTSADWPACNWNCSAGDTEVNRAWLGNAEGNDLPTCTPGELVTAYIWAEFDNGTGTDRDAVRVFDGIYLDGTQTYTLGKCVTDTLPPGITELSVFSFTWTCGVEVEIRDLQLAWKTDGSTCADTEPPTCNDYSPSKCYGPVDLLVKAPLVADFDASTECFCSHTVFTDTTTGGEPLTDTSPYSYTYSWDFGDGLGTSDVPTPTYHYDSAGMYTVTLVVTDAVGTSDAHTETVTVFENPVASFTAAPTSCCAPLTVAFTDTSTTTSLANILAWRWDFGDGDTSTLQNPSHAYDPGTYTVTLTVTDTNGCSDTITRTDHITANGPPTAAFTGAPTSCCAPLTVDFTDQSTVGDNQIVAWSWSFGDGGGSAEQHPSYTYDTRGVYTVTLTVTDSHGCTDTATQPAYVTAYACDLSVTKEADRDAATVGEVIGYTVTVDNAGNAGLSAVSVSDELMALSGPTGDTSNAGTLDPDETWIYTGIYTVTEADLCKDVVNTAEVTATGPCNEVVGPVTGTATVSTGYTAGFTVTKEADRTSVGLGETVNYTITVDNTGDASLSAVVVSDSLLTVSGPQVGEDGDGDGELDPDETWTYTGGYTVSDDDLCAPIENTVTVTATDPCGNQVGPETAVERVSTTYDADFEVTKQADRGTATVGDTIDYTITVDNTGSTSLSGVTVSDSLLAVNGPQVGEDGDGDGELDPEETWTYRGSYLVGEDDLCASIENTVTVTATDPCGNQVGPETAVDSVSTTFDADFTVTKEADGGAATVGDTVNYTVTLNNVGNVGLSAVSVSDDLVALSGPTGDASNLGTLDVDETWTFTGEYVVSEEDICEDIINTVEVTATGPCDDVVGPVTDTMTVSTTYTAGFSVAKEADRTSASVGETIDYTVTVNNTGNASLSDVEAFDSLVALSAASGDLDGDDELDPDEIWTYTASYAVGENDACAPLVNTVIVTATDPCGGALGPMTDTATVSTTYEAEIIIAKETTFVGSATVGDEIGYTITVSNTGDVTVSGVTVNDAQLGIVDDTTLESLEPGAGGTVTGTYTVGETDVCGDVVNTATADAIGPCGDSVGPVTATATVPTTYTAEITIDKETTFAGPATVGDEIAYTIIVSNTGDVTVSGVTVNDPQLGIVDDTTIADLEPGASGTVTGTYTVSEGDVCGSIANSATVTATDPCGGTVGPETDTVTVTTGYDADFTVAKQADRAAAGLGETIAYTVTVDNTGNLGLSDVVLEDELLALAGPRGDTESDGVLGIDETWTYTGSLTVGHDDLCSQIVNTVEVTALDPCDNEIFHMDHATVTTSCEADLSLRKVVVGEAPEEAWVFTGDLGRFSIPAGGGMEAFTVTAGMYTITETLRDGYAAEVRCDTGEDGSGSVTVDLAPGADMTCVFTNTAQPSVAVDKRLTGFDRGAYYTKYVTFTIVVDNVGRNPIDILPLDDVYDSYYLSFVDAIPYPEEDADDGTLTWYDLTGPPPHGFEVNLAPGEAFSVTAVFTVAHEIVTTLNTAVISGAIDTYGNAVPYAVDDLILRDTPTAIGLQYFRADDVSGRDVELAWATAVEVDTLGFKLYRASERDRSRAQLVAAVPSRGHGTGVAYTHVDTVPADGVWWYWLGMTGTSGDETFYGPVSGAVGLSTGLDRVYLPVVLRR